MLGECDLSKQFDEYFCDLIYWTGLVRLVSASVTSSADVGSVSSGLYLFTDIKSTGLWNSWPKPPNT